MNLAKTHWAIAFSVLVSSTSFAQPVEMKYDDVRADSEAQVVCGFCAMDKFGTIFYLSDFPGLSFPLELTKIKLGLTQSMPLDRGLQACSNPASGTANIAYEVYVGQLSQTYFRSNSIRGYPLGAWNTETLVTSGMASVNLNVPSGAATNMPPDFNLPLSEIPITNAGGFGTPSDRYIRVVFDVPAAAGTVDPHCDHYNRTSSALSVFRDDGIGTNVSKNFGYISRQSFPTGWEFNENFRALFIDEDLVDGDWLIRLEVRPSGQPPLQDAGVQPPLADSGVATNPDASAPPPNPDAGNMQDLSLSGITPEKGRNDRPTQVLIIGNGFTENTRAYLNKGESESIPLINLMVLGSSSIQAEVPSGLAAGLYDLYVSDSGNMSHRDSAFLVEDGGEPSTPGDAGPSGPSTARTDSGTSSMGSGSGSTRRPARTSRRTSDGCGCQQLPARSYSDQSHLLGLGLILVAISRRRRSS